MVVESKKVPVPNEDLVFTYEVIWRPSGVPFEKRFDKYLDPSFFQHRIHWFSIFNSFSEHYLINLIFITLIVMVIFLVGLVWMILLRTLSKDYARYHRELDIEADEEINDDYGKGFIRVSKLLRLQDGNKFMAMFSGPLNIL